ncbi:2Fe-2S iron-sulfur cluster binding domain-containing protein [Thiothrix eikelboomii]|uniref:2Fe-2S iron-sulfur cluster binding domain-containing protein n=1 Tax=Thiothrix eikelboomii TaxID=92487 RepID=A0A1T4WEB6_9GAMM|nr:2Fe-2S iron-sulfur cluster binding domain-containing protein [Thiothrix eikelboomii]SKA75368.1 2Fe-2S iron-sulfur cluster binding domain-containing protein [Thiothrix eikelboomii]
MFGLTSGYTIHIPETGASFNCKPQEMLLVAMMRLGKKGIPVGCRSGGCGVCKVQVQQGKYATGKMSRAHISEQEEQAGFVLACRCQPQSDLVITVVGQMRKATHRNEVSSSTAE